MLNCSEICRLRLLLTGLAIPILLGLGTHAFAQRPTHQLFRGDFPPGFIGRMQAMSTPERHGYMQPVEVIVPKGAFVSVACETGFASHGTTLRARMMLGEVYRLKVSNIPRYESKELYPSIEVIDRLHPPVGEIERFPIPIEITQEDLEIALRGDMVVRVIYLENPHEAFPKAEEDHQRYFDVSPGEDPLKVADDEGRPMAILRLGSRVPLDEDDESSFAFGSPPVQLLSESTSRPQIISTQTESGPIKLTPSVPRSEPTATPIAPVVPKKTDDLQPRSLNSDDPFVDDAQ